MLAKPLGAPKPRAAELLGMTIDIRCHMLPLRGVDRILIRLDRLNAANAPEQMNLPGFDFHTLVEALELALETRHRGAV